MDVSTLTTLFTLASFGAALIGLAAIVFAVRGAKAVPRALTVRVALAVATAVAATSTAGSLYYSERAGFVPCELCWWQRIAMYPLVAVVGVAALQRRARAALAALPIALIGLGIAIHHYRLQVLGESGSGCDITAPCNVKWVDEFGFVSIPFMAGCGFLAVIGLLTLALRIERPGRRA